LAQIELRKGARGDFSRLHFRDSWHAALRLREGSKATIKGSLFQDSREWDIVVIAAELRAQHCALLGAAGAVKVSGKGRSSKSSGLAKVTQCLLRPRRVAGRIGKRGLLLFDRSDVEAPWAVEYLGRRPNLRVNKFPPRGGLRRIKDLDGHPGG